jgi:hypothetical protein
MSVVMALLVELPVAVLLMTYARKALGQNVRQMG